MKEKNGEHPYGDAGQYILFVVFFIVWIGDSFFLHQSTFLAKYVPLYIRLALLVLALFTSLNLIRSGHVVVSGESQLDSVVTDGAFQYVRHPLYLANIFIYLGLTFSTFSLLSFALLVAIFIFHNCIASYEEKLLEIKFGEEYLEYKKKTGKWIPKSRNLFKP